MEKTQVLKAYFASLQQSQMSETKGKCWSKNNVPLVEEDQVRKYLSKLDSKKFMCSDGSAEGAGRCHCEVMPDNVWLIMATGKSAWRLKDERTGTVQPWEEKAEGGVSPMYINTWKAGAKKMEPGSFQWNPATGQQAVKDQNTEVSLWPSGNSFSL